MRYIDLRSDTVTTPTARMREAMYNAPVGDDVYEDDPTVRRLEELAAQRVGKQAALFVPSGTMGNQLAIMGHTRIGEEIIVGSQCHIVAHECGAPARLSGVSFAMAHTPDQIIRAHDVRALIREDDIHCPRTSLLCLENALGNGAVVPLEIMRESCDAAHEAGLAVHLDGARLFNAALALGVQAHEVAACADSVMFCVSKGLCAPVGSLLCGTEAFIATARRHRKLLGGGMRQAGVLAACGIVALEEMTQRLAEDHENAAYLARLLGELPGVEILEACRAINMVFWRTARRIDPAALVTLCLEQGIKTNAPEQGLYRFVTHNDVSRADLERTVDVLRGFFT